MPAGPMPVGPMPAGPMPAGPMPVGPMPAGPLLVLVVVGVGRDWFGAVMAYPWLLWLGGCLRRLPLAPWSSPRAGKVGRCVPFPCLCALSCPPQALSRPGLGCLAMAQCWWLFALLFVAVACRLPNLLLYLRPPSLRCSFGCAVLAAIAPLPFVMALLFGCGAAAVGDCAASAGDPSFRCWRPRCCHW
jgi:hypothetical protein